MRFWDIPTRDCTSCFRDIEAATEKQRLHPGISAIPETAETGQTRRGTDPGRGRQTVFPSSIVRFQIGVWGTESGLRRTTAFGENLSKACQFFRNPLNLQISPKITNPSTTGAALLS